MKLGKIKMKNNKKAVSEMISYVLLIVIALSLAAGVYAWMKLYVPAENEEKCSDEIALSINNYNCTQRAGIDDKKIITLYIQNKGLFNVEGFYIRASENYSAPRAEMLNCTTIGSQYTDCTAPGRFDFYRFQDSDGNLIGKLPPQSSVEAIFFLGDLDKIEGIQIQPYVSNKRTNTVLLCDTITDIRIEGCSFP